jgi:hypothetical protein
MTRKVQGFPIDDQPLRERVLKAYHEKRKETGTARLALNAVRQFLSGAPGARNVPGRYEFEDSPEPAVARFMADLDLVRPGFARAALERLLDAVKRMEKQKSRELAPKISVYIASLAGPLALRSGLDETLASAVLSAAVLGLSRLGRKPFEEALR